MVRRVWMLMFRGTYPRPELKCSVPRRLLAQAGKKYVRSAAQARLRRHACSEHGMRPAKHQGELEQPR